MDEGGIGYTEIEVEKIDNGGAGRVELDSPRGALVHLHRLLGRQQRERASSSRRSAL